MMVMVIVHVGVDHYLRYILRRGAARWSSSMYHSDHRLGCLDAIQKLTTLCVLELYNVLYEERRSVVGADEIERLLGVTLAHRTTLILIRWLLRGLIAACIVHIAIYITAVFFDESSCCFFIVLHVHHHQNHITILVARLLRVILHSRQVEFVLLIRHVIVLLGRGLVIL